MIIWKEPLNVSAELDYIADFSEWLDPQSDLISTFDIELPQEAIDLGLELGPIAPAVDPTNKFITIWFEVNDSEEDNSAYDFPGQCFCIKVTITTVGGRVKPETFQLTVRKQLACDG